MPTNVANSFNLNVSRNMGSEKKSPISSSRIMNNQNNNGVGNNRERSSYNDYSLVNNSLDMGGNQNSEEDMQNISNNNGNNKENSILGGILDSSRDNECKVSAGTTPGFKSFYQIMQEKNGNQIDNKQQEVEEFSPKKFTQ